MTLLRSCIPVLWAATLLAQNGVPALRYRLDPNWPKLPPTWNFKETPGVAADRWGRVFVIHRGDHPVMEFNADGAFVRSFGDGLYERPHAVRVDPEGYIWTVDDLGHVVTKMDGSGRVRMVLGRFKTSSDMKSAYAEQAVQREPRGRRDGDVFKFNRPTDVAFGPKGEIYVSDGYGNSRVVKFSKDGTLVKTWGKRGQAPGDFHTPHGIAVDKQGRVYVADRENYRVQVFTGDGDFLKEWTHVGSPWGLAITPDQHIFLADGYNNRVLKLDLDGKVLGALGEWGKQPGQFFYLHHLAVGADGSIYTAEILNWRAQRFVPE